MKYCLDSSALIGLGERHYPEHIPVFAPIWKSLYEGIEQGTILSVDYVKIELEGKAANWRESFLAKANGMFLMDVEIEHEYATLIQGIESDSAFRANGHRKRFMSGADPWVIATARRIGECTVVSSETKSLTDYGMGAVCKHLGVPHLPLIDFIAATTKIA